MTAPVLRGGLLRLIDSPIRCMRARAASGSPRLYSAILAILFPGVPWMAAPLVGQAMEGLFF